ncbi:hypothetical protein JCM30760_21270 [Thiomicrorhabdus hydrogeniphila]
MNANDEIRSTKLAIKFALGFGVVIYFIYSVVLLFSEDLVDIDALSKFGSSTSALFAGLAAYLVFLTLQTQKKELEATREELKQSRIELEKNRKDQFLKSIEERFHSQLSLLSENRKNLWLNEDKKHFEGRDVIEHIITKITQDCESQLYKLAQVSSPMQDGFEDYKKAFDIFADLSFEDQQKVIQTLRKQIKFYTGNVAGSFFLLLKNIDDFILKNEEQFEDSGRYFKQMLKSQLNVSEIKFIYWQSIIVQPALIRQGSFLLKRLKPSKEFFLFDIKAMKDIPDNLEPKASDSVDLTI